MSNPVTVLAIPKTASGKQAWRRTAQYRNWADDVRERDEHTCQCCGRHADDLPDGDYIHAHHIKHATYHPALKFDIDNGISLCEECHGKLHNKIAGGTRKKCDKVHVERLMNLRDYFWEVEHVSIRAAG